MTEDPREAAFTAFALEMSKSHAKMSAAFAALAAGLGGDEARTSAWGLLAKALAEQGEDVAPDGHPVIFSPASTIGSWNERVLRQSLILHEIVQRGGNVPQTVWYEIAARYGYSGRGLAGFFRSNGQGMLELRDNKRVYITKRGKDRLKQNQERVNTTLAASPAAS